MFSKVKAVVVVFVLAALAGIGPAITDTDWGQFGSFGPAIGLAVGAVVAYAVKEVKGYGGGEITKPPA
jgi:hypothetical protein